jgi:Eukaryotic translation initiation factor 3 subunit 8 N-terminus
MDQREYQARISIVKLNYLYYKNDNIYEQIKNRLGGRSTDSVYLVTNSQKIIEELAHVVQKWGNKRQIVRATLQQVYHHAAHDRLREARDLMMKTHMSQIVAQQPTDNQILYNRALV